jgi:hypothetical protein
MPSQVGRHVGRQFGERVKQGRLRLLVRDGDRSPLSMAKHGRGATRPAEPDNQHALA